MRYSSLQTLFGTIIDIAYLKIAQLHPHGNPQSQMSTARQGAIDIVEIIEIIERLWVADFNDGVGQSHTYCGS